MKNHSRNLHAPLCGRFHPNSVAVARYGALIRAKSPTNCDAHLAESLFQTRSRACLKKAFCKMCVTICGRFRPDEGAVAGYGNRIRVKSPAKWGVQITGMIFQTRSKYSVKYKSIFEKREFTCVRKVLKWSVRDW